ncbi:discoidin domain-containing protein [Roseibacillus persicicus]|uniref:discoidin domain-containing protein n=1 Tax=Roseibacillus persicicus TaxID=454148 RepID=UPI00398B010C
MFRSLTLIASLAASLTSIPAQEIDLAGEWKFHLPTAGEIDLSDPGKVSFKNHLQLPGMMTAQGFGEPPNINTRWTGGGWIYREMFTEYQAADNFKFPFFLQPPRYYVGPAWYQKTFTVPASDQKGSYRLHLERAHWQTTVWVDGEKKAAGEALGTPQELSLGQLPPGEHSLTLRIDNRLQPVHPGTAAHSVTDHTQGNWNGVVGDLKLKFIPENHLQTIRVDPKINGSFSLTIRGHAEKGMKVVTTVTAKNNTEEPKEIENIPLNEDGELSLKLDLEFPGKIELWDEFNPALYEVSVALLTEEKTIDVHKETFGFREVSSQNGGFTINGRPLYLRGALDCAIFPKTGHPPTDLPSWKKVMETCREYGLNHIRFHSWCPPKAAFQAADEIGIYLQPEVSTWSHNDSFIGSGRPLDEWSQRETARMIEHFGNHPSFLLIAHGNEPHGPNHAKWLQQWVAKWQQEDKRRLYTTGSGWTTMPGSDFHSIPNPRLQQWGEGLRSRLNAIAPSTSFDFSQIVRNRPDAPIVAHESGQWCAYPDFKIIEKFDGFFKSKNYEIFRDLAKKNGLGEEAETFLHDSGRLQVLAYKHDIEAALRTPGLGGFQLLGLQDFSGQGTAPVGVVDVFWDPKPYVTAQEFRQFCQPTVALARLPQMVFRNDEKLTAELELSHFAPLPLNNCQPYWTLKKGDAVLSSGKLPRQSLAPYQLHQLGTMEASLSEVEAPTKLTFTVGISGTEISNSWDLFVYPANLAEAEEPLIIDNWEETARALADGKDVFFMPPADQIGDDPEHPLLQGFSPIFWNTAYTTWQAPHTLGLSLDPQHPAFRHFPTDTHSNWQWWEIQKGARPFILKAHPEIKPVVEIIDDWFTARRLGFVFEAQVGSGRLLACGLDLKSDLDQRPAARQLRHSLVRYFESEDFQPKHSLTPNAVYQLLRQPTLAQQLGLTISASSAEPNFPAEHLTDGSNKRIWHTEFSRKSQPHPHTLKLHFADEVTLAGLVLTQRQDGNPNGQLKEMVALSPDGEELARATVPLNSAEFPLVFTKPFTGQSLSLRVLNSHNGPFSSLADLEPLLPKKEINDQ